MSDHPCRLCYWWKRRTAVSGTCWLRAEVYPAKEASTSPDATCDGWTAKVERAEASV
jgi:hypothetical protein